MSAAPVGRDSNREPTGEMAQAVEPGVLPHLIDFFDQDHDGKISLKETISGLHRLGIGRLGSVVTGLGINLGLAAFLRESPFALSLTNVSKVKHPADTDITDADGRFREQRFEEVFRKYGGPNRDALTGISLVRLFRDDVLRDLQPSSIFGAMAAVGELGLLYYLGGEETDRGKALTKQRMHDFYTRTDLFERIAQEQDEARRERDKTISGKLVNAFRAWIF